MKKVFSLMLVALLFFAPVVMAGDFTDDFFDDESRNNTFNVGIDFPNLIQLTDSGFIGVEGWKQGLSSNGDDDYAIGIKYTNRWTWKDLRKGE